MCLMTYFFAITEVIVLFIISFKSLIFSKQNALVLIFEIVSDIKLSEKQKDKSTFRDNSQSEYFI